jgi:hypothetical protein
MSANEPNVSKSVWIIELHHQPVFIARNIEYHPVPANNTCIAELSFHIRGIGPLRFFHGGVPQPEWFLAITILWNSPKFLDRFPGNYPQCNSSEPL